MAFLPYISVFYQFISEKASPNLQFGRKNAAPNVCKVHKGLRFCSLSVYLFAIFTATSSAIFIMLVKVVWRSSADSSVPLTKLSEMEQMASARLPV